MLQKGRKALAKQQVQKSFDAVEEMKQTLQTKDTFYWDINFPTLEELELYEGTMYRELTRSGLQTVAQ